MRRRGPLRASGGVWTWPRGLGAHKFLQGRTSPVDRERGSRAELEEIHRWWGWTEDRIHAPVGDGDRLDARWVREGVRGWGM